jgi:hypothetical protein
MQHLRRCVALSSLENSRIKGHGNIAEKTVYLEEVCEKLCMRASIKTVK